jgi:hypothetical protein
VQRAQRAPRRGVVRHHTTWKERLLL